MEHQPGISRPGPEAGAATPFRLALDHYRQGRHQAALRLLQEALRAEPNNAPLWNLAGSSAKALGQATEAERCWRCALALAPDYADAHHNLGMLLHEQQRITEAVAAYRQALAGPPWQAQALNNLGAALTKLGKLEEALESFEGAVARQPGHAKAHHNRGRALVALGRFEEARQAVRTAIVEAPPEEKIRFYRTLAFLQRFVPGDPSLLEMEELARRPETLPAADRMELHFALGKAYADLGQRERSFEHFLAGNGEKRRLSPYDEAAALDEIRRVREAFTAERMKTFAGSGHASPVPVFIVGMPRSGSSLVEQILASHSQVHGAGESEDFRVLAEAMALPGGGRLLPDGIAALPPLGALSLGKAYQQQMSARAPAATRIVDKNLNNFLRVGLIHLVLPQARIIHTRRDPADTCLSCFSRLFNGDHPYSYDLAELGRYWRAYDGLMAHWRAVLPPGVMLEMQYEELVQDLEGQTRRMLDHCGLDWQPACLDFHRTQRPVFTASATQVREPVFHGSVGKWRNYEQQLQPLLKALTG
jgi:tetratricopeptide (TPR) repeat protein